MFSGKAHYHLSHSAPNVNIFSFSVRIKVMFCWALVAHACHPSYSGGRDQGDHSSKPALGKQFAIPYLEKTHHTKRARGVLKVQALSSSPSTAKKKKSYVSVRLWSVGVLKMCTS
jgi:hypothetical protein